jgi:SAM-dependent methyltransferase
MDADRAYAERLARLQTATWKRVLRVQAPLAWNLRRLQPGFTLDLGCGIGRTLDHLGGFGVGIDVNAHCVGMARARGLTAFTPAEFSSSDYDVPGRFDSLLLAHVAEHLGETQAISLVERYRGLLRPHGRLILIAPQEAGFATDATHVEFLDFSGLTRIAQRAGFEPARTLSFPFPRFAGRLFPYNEFVVVATRREASASGLTRAGAA